MIVAAEVKTTHWKHFQARAPEWFNAIVLLLWGSYVILHPGMFADPRTAAMWKGLVYLASQETWGLVALLAGFIRAGALYVNGRHHRTPTVRLVCSFLSAFVLTQIVMGLWNSGVPNTGLTVYPVLILADIYSAFRASSDMTFVARQHETVPSTEAGGVIDFPKRA